MLKSWEGHVVIVRLSFFLSFPLQYPASAERVRIRPINHGTQSMNQYLPSPRRANNDHQTLNAKNAGALDKDLMSIGAFSLDQLMELAGLSVSQAGS